MFDKFLKQFPVGRALITFFGNAITEDRLGRKTEHACGLFWKPWDVEDRTVATENGFAIEGDPGETISIKVFKGSLRDRKVLEEVPPTYENRGTKVFKYTFPLFVVITGQDTQERWAVSHWRMFSGLTVFDLAKNRFWLETEPEYKAELNELRKPEPPVISDEEAQRIAGVQAEGRKDGDDDHKDANLPHKPGNGNGKDRKKFVKPDHQAEAQA